MGRITYNINLAEELRWYLRKNPKQIIIILKEVQDIPLFMREIMLRHVTNKYITDCVL